MPKAPEGKKDVMLRMHEEKLARLDKLTQVNQRSRREIAEILIDHAYLDWLEDPSDRINPPPQPAPAAVVESST